MANWKDVDNLYFGFTYKDVAYTYPTQYKMYVSLQYDADSAKTTSVDVRFKCALPNGNTYGGTDGIYLMYDANNTSDLRSVYELIKQYSSEKKAYYSKTLTLTKKYDAGTFFLQDVWVCNVGHITPDVDNMTVEYKDIGKKSFYDVFKEGGNRERYAYRQTSGQYIPIATDNTVAIDGTAPTINIKDTGDNHFIISGTTGKAGDNNELKEAKFYYTTDGTAPGTYATTTNVVNLGNTASSSFSKKFETKSSYSEVKAYAICSYVHNSKKTNTVSQKVKYYAAPSAPGKPSLTYNKSRLTVKEPWTFKWNAATAANSNSPVKGYYIKIYRCAKGESTFKEVTGLVSSTSNNYITKGSGSDNYTARESTSCVAIFSDPTKFGFAAGDKVKFRVRAYTRNGLGELKQSENYTDSDEYLVKNAGIVHINVGGSWKESQVYIKTGGSWKEAESVNERVNGSWKESQ